MSIDLFSMIAMRSRNGLLPFAEHACCTLRAEPSAGLEDDRGLTSGTFHLSTLEWMRSQRV